MIASELKNDEFKASNGWLESFRKRNNVSFATLSEESDSVNKETVADWQSRIERICEGYSPDNIFNLDETGLFFRALPSKSLVLKGDSCKGGKKAKDRLTVMLCCSWTGEKLTPLVIGKAKSPRCFKGINVQDLSVTWRWNRKAWMTSTIFQEWLLGIDRLLGMRNRKILLFADNASCHLPPELVNIKLQFLPPNTTSLTQPLDQGIIKNMKVFYGKNFLYHVVSKIDEMSSAAEVSSSVNVLQAISWITQAWRSVEEKTISACFAKSGFIHCHQFDDVELQLPDVAEELEEVCPEDPEEFVTMDDNLATFESTDDSWEQKLLEKARKSLDKDAFVDSDCESDEDEVEDEVEESQRSLSSFHVTSYRQASESLREIQEFCLRQNDGELYSHFISAQTVIDHRRFHAAQSARQSTILEFFS